MKQQISHKMDSNLYAQVNELSQHGDHLVAEKAYNEALRSYMDALQLLPDPVESWEAATWLLSAIGDAYYFQGNYERALEAFSDVLTCPGGLGNPFIHLRLGEIHYELQNINKAKDELTRAYMGAGKDIFTKEDPKYIDWLAKYIRLV